MSDVNAATERWRLDNKAEEHKEYARSPYKGNFDLRLEDAYLLADAYLALHPADDGEAIDEAWLEANGFEPALPAKWLFKKGRLLWSSYDGLSLTNDLDGDLPWIKTRGQLRRLLAAIG